ncbi:hypothetical protein DBR06_SOUSAS28510001, partial [Sousa chinensis]
VRKPGIPKGHPAQQATKDSY